MVWGGVVFLLGFVLVNVQCTDFPPGTTPPSAAPVANWSNIDNNTDVVLSTIVLLYSSSGNQDLFGKILETRISELIHGLSAAIVYPSLLSRWGEYVSGVTVVVFTELDGSEEVADSLQVLLNDASFLHVIGNSSLFGFDGHHVEDTTVSLRAGWVPPALPSATVAPTVVPPTYAPTVNWDDVDNNTEVVLSTVVLLYGAAGNPFYFFDTVVTRLSEYRLSAMVASNWMGEYVSGVTVVVFTELDGSEEIVDFLQVLLRNASFLRSAVTNPIFNYNWSKVEDTTVSLRAGWVLPPSVQAPNATMAPTAAALTFAPTYAPPTFAPEANWTDTPTNTRVTLTTQVFVGVNATCSQLDKFADKLRVVFALSLEVNPSDIIIQASTCSGFLRRRLLASKTIITITVMSTAENPQEDIDTIQELLTGPAFLKTATDSNLSFSSVEVKKTYASIDRSCRESIATFATECFCPLSVTDLSQCPAFCTQSRKSTCRVQIASLTNCSVDAEFAVLVSQVRAYPAYCAGDPSVSGVAEASFVAAVSSVVVAVLWLQY